MSVPWSQASESDRGRRRKDVVRSYQKRRTQVLRALGGKCVQCGFCDPRALQIDHVDGGGHIERRKLKNPGQAFLNHVLVKENHTTSWSKGALPIKSFAPIAIGSNGTSETKPAEEGVSRMSTNNYFKSEDGFVVVFAHVSVWKPIRTACAAKRARIDVIGLQSAQHLRARLHELDGTVLENARKAVANLDAEWARVA